MLRNGPFSIRLALHKDQVGACYVEEASRDGVCPEQKQSATALLLAMLVLPWLASRRMMPQ